jgi:hypothetical protein
MRALPDRFRELLVLRELEGLSYREVADAMDIPMGTVMSGLSRARQALRSALDAESSGFYTPERTRARVREPTAFHIPEAHAHATARELETASAAVGTGKRLDRYAAPSGKCVPVVGPHSGPRRAERAEETQATSQGSAGYQGQSPWLVREEENS